MTLVPNHRKWEGYNDAISVSAEPESHGEPVAVRTAGFLYSRHRRAALHCDAGAAWLVHAAATSGQLDPLGGEAADSNSIANFL